MYGNRPQRMAPVKVGDEIDVKIEAIGEKGDGIARKEGFVLIVPGANKDDEVHVRITRVLRKVGFAEVVGKAQGPVTAAPKQEKPKKKADEGDDYSEDGSSDDSEDAPAESEDMGGQDSEDFGEDLDQ